MRVFSLRLQIATIDQIQDLLMVNEDASTMIRIAIAAELANRRRFQRNGPFEPTVVRIVGRDKNQRLIVSDGGDLLTDGIDGEIVRGGE